VGFRAGLDTEARGEFLCLCRGLNPGHPVCRQTLYCVTNYSSSSDYAWHSFAYLFFFKYKFFILPNTVVEWLTLLLHILEDSGSILGPETDYLD
jgi:hypothetical protein